MNNEIKEILNGIARGDWKQLLPREANELLDYITNLQAENERKERLIIQYGDGMCAYSNRIDKAIECIEKQKKKMYKSRNKIALFVLMKLENILQNGSDSQ